MKGCSGGALAGRCQLPDNTHPLAKIDTRGKALSETPAQVERSPESHGYAKDLTDTLDGDEKPAGSLTMIKCRDCPANDVTSAR